jgi:predicted nucleic acid-binding protein
VALDTAVFIYHFEKNERYFDLASEIFSRLDQDESFEAVTSIVTLLEVCVKPLREGRKDLADRYAEKLLHDEKLTTWVIDESVAREAAGLRAKYGVRTPDAIQLATALVGGPRCLLPTTRI